MDAPAAPAENPEKKKKDREPRKSEDREVQKERGKQQPSNQNRDQPAPSFCVRDHVSLTSKKDGLGGDCWQRGKETEGEQDQP